MSRSLTRHILVAGSRTGTGRAVPEGASTWDPVAFEDAVEATLGRVLVNPVGKLVVSSIRRRVRIIPFARFTTDPIAASAETLPLDHSGAMVRGERIRWCQRHVCTERETESTWVGSGRGSASRIAFTPQMWPRMPGRVPADEVLLHELVHAMQHTCGVLSWRPEGMGYDTFAEVCAITITNMYRSHFFGSRAHLRANHGRRGSFRGDPYPVRDAPDLIYFFGPSEARSREWRLLDRFCRLQPALAAALRALPLAVCPYNPLRDRAQEMQTGSLDGLGSWGPPRPVTR